MSGEPVKINLKDSAIPFRMSVAQQIPLRFQELANAVIKGLIENKVIVPARNQWIGVPQGLSLIHI